MVRINYINNNVHLTVKTISFNDYEATNLCELIFVIIV